jgi:hypothetical protein
VYGRPYRTRTDHEDEALCKWRQGLHLPARRQHIDNNLHCQLIEHAAGSAAILWQRANTAGQSGPGLIAPSSRKRDMIRNAETLEGLQWLPSETRLHKMVRAVKRHGVDIQASLPPQHRTAGSETLEKLY